MKISHLLLPVLAATTLAACLGKDDSTTPPATTPPAALQRGDIVNGPPAKVGTYAPTDLLALLGANDIGKTFLQLAYTPLCTVTVYHLEYETVDPAQNLHPGLWRGNDSEWHRQSLHRRATHRAVRSRHHDRS